MTQWDYKHVWLERSGNQEFLSSWTYSPWRVLGSSRSLQEELQELGRQGWELVGVLPNEYWAEGGGMGSASHGVRAISYGLLFKRPLGEV